MKGLVKLMIRVNRVFIILAYLGVILGFFGMLFGFFSMMFGFIPEKESFQMLTRGPIVAIVSIVVYSASLFVSKHHHELLGED